MAPPPIAAPSGGDVFEKLAQEAARRPVPPPRELAKHASPLWYRQSISPKKSSQNMVFWGARVKNLPFNFVSQDSRLKPGITGGRAFEVRSIEEETKSLALLK